MPYLAIHTPTDQLLLGTGGTTYKAHDVRLPAPRPRTTIALAQKWGARVTGRFHELAERSIPLDILADTEVEAETALIALQRAVDTHRARLMWQSDEGRPLIYSTIRAAHVSESQLGKDRKHGQIDVIFECVTDDYWTDTEGIAFPPLGQTLPHLWDITSTKGDRPGRCQMKFTASSANTLLGFSIEVDPADDYDSIDEHTPSAETLTSDYASIITAPAFDTNANRGPTVLMTRFATNAVDPTNTRLRAVASVAGSGVSDTAEAEYDSVAASAAGPVWIALPSTAYIPAGGIPRLSTGSGFGAEAVLESATVRNAEHDIAATGGTRVAETFEPGEAILLAVTAYIDNDSGESVTVYADLYATDENGAPTGWALAHGGAVAAIGYDAELKMTFFNPYTSADQVYALVLYTSSGVSSVYADFDTNGGHADGDMYELDPLWEELVGDDLYFKVHGRESLGFNSYVDIEAKCSESSKTGTVYDVVRLMASHFAVVVPDDYDASDGFLIDAEDPIDPPAIFSTVFATGTAGPALSPSVWIGTPAIWPGVNRFTLIGDGTSALQGTYWPCYSHAAAGEL